MQWTINITLTTTAMCNEKPYNKLFKPRTWPPFLYPHSLLFASFPDFRQNRYFFKRILNAFRIKKPNCNFEELSNLYSFLLFCGLKQKIEPSWWILDYKISRSTKPQTYKLHLIIHQQLQQCYFGLNVISALFLIAGIHSTTTNLRTYEQAKKK